MKLIYNHPGSQHNIPRVSLVGAGPGDPELITIKGARALGEANVVLYDTLVNESLLEYASGTVLKICVGKKPGYHHYSQKEINHLIVDLALRYGHVVRLKGGDPFIFGRGFEELSFVSAFNIPVTVIPGISSALAIPALHKIPLTHRGISESFWVITGVNSNGELSNDLMYAAKSNTSVVILMGMKKLPEITEVFSSVGKENIPVVIIQNGSLKNERIVSGTIRDIVYKTKVKKIHSPAIILIGRIVRLYEYDMADKIESFNNKYRDVRKNSNNRILSNIS
ncbi:MAG: uroporphyrinogen-III C-methyltransferase [Chlorobi bacterium]|nr:uroporphyrinogen-III C-methyltransferase [Chlorobiota bacterium]